MWVDELVGCRKAEDGEASAATWIRRRGGGSLRGATADGSYQRRSEREKGEKRDGRGRQGETEQGDRGRKRKGRDGKGRDQLKVSWDMGRERRSRQKSFGKTPQEPEDRSFAP